jgi:simple sugar transport system ATP-binding protein
LEYRVPDTHDGPTPLVALRGISKSFGGVTALRNIDFHLFPGEMTALLGDNGAGKSTLVNILSGINRPDAGEMRLRGVPVDLERFTVEKARRLGLETVHQDRALAGRQALWRNVFMGRHLTNRFGFIAVAREKAVTMDLLRNRLGLRGLGLTADSEASVLSGGERQGLTIGRAMHFQADVVILDEPTTALSLQETKKVLEFMEQVKRENKSCLFVSHNMRHAYLAADRFYIMDRGCCVGEYRKHEISEDTLMRIVFDAASGQETV